MALVYHPASVQEEEEEKEVEEEEGRTISGCEGERTPMEGLE